MNIKDLFAGWSFIVWAPLVVICAGLMVYKASRTVKVVAILAGLKANILFTRYHPARLFLKTLCVVGASTFLLIALLRPQAFDKEKNISQQGREIFIVLDVSRSMLATDCSPDRLTCAKNKIQSLLTTIACERVGLILFSGDAFVQCPLTADYDAFQLFLSHVDAETISSGTTALDKAIEVALRSFQHVHDNASKMVILFTDGEDFSQNLQQLKARAKKERISLFAFGVGTAHGAPIPVLDDRGNQTGHQKDAGGAIVISRLNEQLLANVTDELGGVYVRMTDDMSDVAAVTSWIDSFDRKAFADTTIIMKKDFYPYFLAGGLCCLLVEWLL